MAPLSMHAGVLAESSMINKEQTPVEWAMLMYELDDAREHLENMIEEMNSDPAFDESVFRVGLGHIFSHLNRAWHRRNLVGDLDDEAWHAASKFPSDLEAA